MARVQCAKWWEHGPGALYEKFFTPSGCLKDGKIHCRKRKVKFREFAGDEVSDEARAKRINFVREHEESCSGVFKGKDKRVKSGKWSKRAKSL